MSAPAVVVTPIGGDTSIVDLCHLGRRGIIGVNVLELAGGIALVDPGPEAGMPALRAGLAEMGRSLEDVRAVLLTHIHLDHATAAGAIVREEPAAEVFVHAVGAPHMADPARLLASAGRIYGDAMTTLWGDFLPVPRGSLRVVEEGDVLELGGRRLEVAYVPGHARHHVAYHEAATGTAWVGDVGGIRIGNGPALPVTPPPDIDVEVWKDERRVGLAEPALSQFETSALPIATPGIHHTLAQDLYLSVTRIDEEAITLRAATAPLQWVLWLGGLTCAAGGLYSLAGRRRRRSESVRPAERARPGG